MHTNKGILKNEELQSFCELLRLIEREFVWSAAWKQAPTGHGSDSNAL